MLTLIIILAIAISAYTGYRRGLVIQGIRLIGYIITFILSTQYYDKLAGFVEMIVPFPALKPDSTFAIYSQEASLNMDLAKAFYGVVTFLLIALVGWLVTNFLASLFRPLQYYNLWNLANGISGAIINALITYVVIYFILFALSLIPIEFIQQQFVNNPIAYWIVSQTPFLSSFVSNLWLNINPF